MDITDFDNTKNMNNDEWTFCFFFFLCRTCRIEMRLGNDLRMT